MPNQAFSRRSFSRTLIIWTWLFLALTLSFGSTPPPDATLLFTRCDTLETPKSSLEWVATTAQKSKSAHLFLDALLAVPPAETVLAVLRSPILPPAWDDAPSLLLPVAWQSPSLSRPPPGT